MKPIIFNSEMVKAILSGKKTQTRRVMKVQPDDDADINVHGHNAFIGRGGMRTRVMCPYGLLDEKLWVRERWRRYSCADECACYDDCKCSGMDGKYLYYADSQDDEHNWKPSIHMPKEAARIFLKIKHIRVERVQEISEEEAKQEGITPDQCPRCGYTYADCRYWLDHHLCSNTEPVSNVEKFRGLWDSINAERGYGWDANPWVWCIEFERDES